jgi:hypothetical protein
MSIIKNILHLCTHISTRYICYTLFIPLYRMYVHKYVCTVCTVCMCISMCMTAWWHDFLGHEISMSTTVCMYCMCIFDWHVYWFDGYLFNMSMGKNVQTFILFVHEQSVNCVVELITLQCLTELTTKNMYCPRMWTCAVYDIVHIGSWHEWHTKLLIMLT